MMKGSLNKTGLISLFCLLIKGVKKNKVKGGFILLLFYHFYTTSLHFRQAVKPK